MEEFDQISQEPHFRFPTLRLFPLSRTPLDDEHRSRVNWRMGFKGAGRYAAATAEAAAPPVNSVGHSTSVIKFHLCYNSKEGEGENEAPFSKPDAPGCT